MMADLIDRQATNADGFEYPKIKTHFAQIIVGGSVEKPCYDILYFDPTDREYHIGFGSYCLEYVFKWLAEEFEIVEAAHTVDAVEVVRCKDCKHRGDYGCPMYHEEYSEWVDDGYHESEIIEHDRTRDDGFCDLGERREDDGSTQI